MTVRRPRWAGWAGTAQSLLIAGAFCGAASAEGPADGDACARVTQALRGLGNAPHYHWTVKATSPARRRPMEREQVVIGDVVYLTPDEGRWMKQRITRTERSARMDDEISRNPPSQCRVSGQETSGGTALVVYDYKQAGIDKRIWIATEDGLPHLFTSSEPPVAVTMSVDYGEYAAPLP